jgi:hypothetical protein
MAIKDKKLFRNRKAMVFNILVVIMTIVILTYAYLRLSAKTDSAREIGEEQMGVITQAQEGEKALIFIDFAAKMALYQAIYDLQSQGGISETAACGTYYGFNRWNGDSGQTCFVDSKTAMDSLRDLFVSNLVARVASYPSADFVGNVPTAAFARGMALAAASRMGVAAEGTTAVPACRTDDFMQDFTYGSASGFFPDNGGRVWVPAEASCAGSYPLIVFLHGCMRSTHASVHRNFGDGLDNDIIPLAKRIIQTGLSKPVILAAPSQTVGSAMYDGVPDSPCGESLWGSEFDPSRFVDLVRTKLPDGVTISSVSFIGHAEAGCSINTGTHKAASGISGLFALGQFDSCAARVLGDSLKTRLGTTTRFLAIYSSTATQREEQDAAMGISSIVECPDTEITGGGLRECLSSASGSFLSYTMEDVSGGSHGKALLVGTEQFLKRMFGPEAVASPGVDVAVEEEESGSGPRGGE